MTGNSARTYIFLAMLTRAFGAATLPVSWLARSPASAQVETQLLAKSRVFPEVGASVRAIKRAPSGRYCILKAPAPAILLFDAAGKPVGQIPALAATPGATSSASSKVVPLVYGDDLDVDSTGRVYVADRGADAVKIFSASGTLEATLPIAAPTSVVALTEGEIAVATMKYPQLVVVFDSRGRVVREFGEPADIADRPELRRFLNIGRLATDADGNLYYAFSYLPEPTVRKYDRHGSSQFEIELKALEFQPAAQAARREITHQERGRSPQMKPIVTAVAVDSQTRELWVALGGQLLHFDSEGNRRGTYRTFTPEGARLEAAAILVEPDRLLLASDPLGIYDFPRPDKSSR